MVLFTVDFENIFSRVIRASKFQVGKFFKNFKIEWDKLMKPKYMIYLFNKRFYIICHKKKKINK